MTGKKAPPAPKKPMASFFLYKKAMNQEFKKLHPDKKVSELTTLISERWKTEPIEVQNKYKEEYKVAKEKYDKEIRAYEDEFGKPERKKKKIKKDCHTADTLMTLQNEAFFSSPVAAVDTLVSPACISATSSFERNLLSAGLSGIKRQIRKHMTTPSARSE